MGEGVRHDRSSRICLRVCGLGTRLRKFPLPPFLCAPIFRVDQSTLTRVLMPTDSPSRNSSAKNHKYVTICTSPQQYPSVIAEMDANVRQKCAEFWLTGTW